MQGTRVYALEVIAPPQQGFADGQGEVCVDASLDQGEQVDGFIDVDKLVVVVQNRDGIDVVLDQQIHHLADGRVQPGMAQV